ncbi:hypothetical protein K8R78_03945 [bacterium]|nr:hypothetical protein [bacterium]
MKRFSLIMLLVLSSGLLLTSCDETADQTLLLGHWDGFMTVMGIDVGFAIEFSEGDDGLTALMDSSSQGAYGLPVEAIALDGEAVSFELPTPIGLAYYKGTIDGSTITGTFTQNGYTDVFTLTLYDPADYPYTQEEVTIEAADGFPLRGTLTLPEGEGPHPAVILITGSGPQDRDEEIFGFEPFRVIADHLSRNGYAVLRCDDRSLGQPLEMFNNITTAELANDIIDQLAYLRGRDEIDAIGLFGHSEGAIVSMMIAAEDDEVAFIMFMGGQGLTGEEVMVEQLVAIMSWKVPARRASPPPLLSSARYLIPLSEVETWLH